MDKDRKCTILVVEDELLVRFVSSDALSEAGYEVIEAKDADEALRLMEEAGTVHLVFTDIRMPGSMNGVELARMVHERWPHVRLLLTSGDTWPPKDHIPDDGRFIAKPYRIETLRKEVRDLLND